jgi:hypothetical protein
MPRTDVDSQTPAHAPGAPTPEPGLARPMVTKAEAAALCQVSEDVIRRALRAQKFPNARQDDTPLRTWRIPVTDLGAAGFKPGAPTRGAPEVMPGVAFPFPVHARTVEVSEHEAVVRERDALRVQVAELSGRLAGMTEAVELAKMIGRLLPAAPVDAHEPPEAPVRRRGGLVGWLAGPTG